MADQELLKYARARDDQEFMWRVTAAMTVEAQYRLGVQPDMSVEARKLIDWVLDHPMEPDPLMMAFVSTDEAVASRIVIDEGRVDTSNVPDQTIKAAVGARWNIVAKRRFTVA